MEEDGSCQWQLPVYSLTVLMELHHLELGAEERKKVPALKDGRSIVRNTTGTAVFVVDGTEAEAPPGERSQPKKPAQMEVQCEVCSKWIKPDRMRQHMGAHILCEDSWEKDGVTKPSFPCGLCGVRPSIGQIMIDPSQALGCPCGVIGTKGHPKPQHQCKLLGDVSYSLGSAAKCSLATPCTNRPIKCTVCSMTVWSYSMEHHFELKHRGMPMCALAINYGPYLLNLWPLLTALLTLLCLGLQARGARQARQARLSREGACVAAAEGEHVQERLQGRFLRMQGPLAVDLSLKRQP